MSRDLISIHAPTRGATLHRPQLTKIRVVFQSTLPREERRSKASLIAFFSYFNPRSHERSDDSSNPKGLYVKISIHAPTRGATKRYATKGHKRPFQSTLPREERQLCTKQLFSEELFQSTLPREERRHTAS